MLDGRNNAGYSNMGIALFFAIFFTAAYVIAQVLYVPARHACLTNEIDLKVGAKVIYDDGTLVYRNES